MKLHQELSTGRRNIKNYPTFFVTGSSSVARKFKSWSKCCSVNAPLKMQKRRKCNEVSFYCTMINTTINLLHDYIKTYDSQQSPVRFKIYKCYVIQSFFVTSRVLTFRSIFLGKGPFNSMWRRSMSLFDGPGKRTFPV